MFQLARPKIIGLNETTAPISRPQIIASSDSLTVPNPVVQVMRKNKVSASPLFRAMSEGLIEVSRGQIIKPPEFDLKKISALRLNEELFQISIQKTVERLMNGGYTIKSRSKNTVEYIKTRLAELEDMAEEPFSVTMDAMLNQLAMYSNSFLYLYRNSDKSTGREVRITGTERFLEPIAALEVVDPTNMMPLISKRRRRVERWFLADSYSALDDGTIPLSSLFLNSLSETTGTYLSRYDVIHMILNRYAGYIFGCPLVTPTIPDIVELRKVEELASLILYQRAYPLIHGRIGTEEEPRGLTDTAGNELEVERVANKFNEVPLEGVLFTSRAVEFQKVMDGYDAEKSLPLIKHYKARVEEGLGLTSLEKGDNTGTSRASAHELGKEGISRSNYIGLMCQRQLNFSLINNLLREGNIDPSDESINAQILFNDLDLSVRTLKETHALSLYQNNAITEDELREELGRYSLSEEERNGLFLYMVQEKQMEMEADLQSELQSQKAEEDRATQKVRGTNQSGGRKAGPSKK